jgi:hypothetical protein
MPDMHKFKPPAFSKRLITIVGGFGSGKSEVAVNLVRHLCSNSTEPVTIADLDIKNPYFRSREAAAELVELGVKSLVPPGDQASADLPIIIPEIKGAMARKNGYLVLDVGGDDLGATVLSSLADAFALGNYELLLTLNAKRPFTSDIEGALKVLQEIETASRLRFTGIISNTHLLGETTPEIVLQGLVLARQVSKRTRLPICFLSAVPEVAKQLDPGQVDCPLLTINRSLLKPWERKSLPEETER